jgi:hypothetical protein
MPDDDDDKGRANNSNKDELLRMPPVPPPPRVKDESPRNETLADGPMRKNSAIVSSKRPKTMSFLLIPVSSSCQHHCAFYRLQSVRKSDNMYQKDNKF